MKILIITQVVDTRDTGLGFFVNWIKKIAERVDSVEVIALRVGVDVKDYGLPKNVRVHSLEKEKGSNRFRRIYLFYYFCIKYIRDYDTVFVHMNQEYVLLGGFIWKIFAKKVFFWRNHRRGNWLTRISVFLSNKVLYTSAHSFTAQYIEKGKSLCMPVGVDESLVTGQGTKDKNSVLVFGRIAPIKRIRLAIDACILLRNAGIPITLSVVGDTLPKDLRYERDIKARVAEVNTHDWITFLPGVPFTQAPEVFRHHEIFLNCTESGSFDKTIIEALAAGLKVMTTNESLKDILPKGSYSKLDEKSLMIGIHNLLSMGISEGDDYKKEALALVHSHSLDRLIDQLCILFSA